MKQTNKTPILLTLIFLAVIIFSFSSCNTVKDCRGVKHTKLPNGVRL